MNEAYKKQVALLLNILLEVNNEKCFALHGGTAINLFHQNMPRLITFPECLFSVFRGFADSQIPRQ